MKQTTTLQFTRQDYLNGNCTHEQYYNQFLNNVILNRVESAIGKDVIIKALADDKNLNTIPLAKWDAIATNLYDVSRKMKEAGDYLTLAGGVCIAKAAARKIANS